MILNACVPCHLAKFGDIARYFHNGARQIDTVWDMEPSTDGTIGIQFGDIRIPHTDVFEIERPVSIRSGDIWVTHRGYEARILETAAPGLHPIVALVVVNGTSTPYQFSWTGLSANTRHHLIRPKWMENAPCPSMTTTSMPHAHTTAA